VRGLAYGYLRTSEADSVRTGKGSQQNMTIKITQIIYSGAAS